MSHDSNRPGGKDREPALDIPALRAHRPGESGRAMWRSLDQIAQLAQIAKVAEVDAVRAAARTGTVRESAHGDDWGDALSRRDVLKLMGAALALGGASACTAPPREQIVPYVERPELLVPGKPLFYATAIPRGGYARGVLVETHMGRPTKIEGNPLHPASLGATDAITQAEILSLYDPERSRVLVGRGPSQVTWQRFTSDLQVALQVHRADAGDGLRVLTGAVTSPTLTAQLEALIAELPRARWHRWEPVGLDRERAGLRIAFGDELSLHHRIERADVIVALDCDLLARGPGAVRYAREFARRRRAGLDAGAAMNRLYVAEPTPTVTGTMADHRWPAAARDIDGIARAIARGVGVNVLGGPGGRDGGENGPEIWPEDWIAGAVADLTSHRGSGLVVAGPEQPAAVHALVAAINDALGNTGQTVVYTEPVETGPVDGAASLAALTEDISAGRVQTLVILEANPVDTAPADLEFARQLRAVRTSVRLGLYEDETSALCTWHVPGCHALEQWTDARAHDGTITVAQPVIAPLYRGVSAHELVSVLAGKLGRSSYHIVRDHWTRPSAPDAASDAARGEASGELAPWWRRAVHDGVLAGSALPERAVALRASAIGALAPPETGAASAPVVPSAQRRDRAEAAGAAEFEVVLRPSAAVWDGSYANNAWLQELPDPITKLTWDNAVLIGPATAERLGVSNGDVVAITVGDRAVSGPIWITPGTADGSLSVPLGYGRRRVGAVGRGVGFRGYALSSSEQAGGFAACRVRKTGARRELATTQDHGTMDAHTPVHTGTLAEYRRDPALTPPGAHHAPRLSLYPEFRHDGYKWGMTIDLTSCTGCNACVVACQAENNIPTVGKQAVQNGREMHWIRVDRYFAGPPGDPRILPQPVPCMHCEKAPCEYVCPVHATVHSPEGLNDMVYNRCVGTRYCSNNCPYKVRRFNFFQWVEAESPTLALMRNPDVTVRSRGVMEKCTYCVQRINHARIEAKKQGRPIRDGDVVTACQQVCPSEAITFGDLNDPDSRVSRLKRQPRDYALLEEVNTWPRTTYLARVTNPKED